MYKLVAKNGLGSIVAGATKLGAAPHFPGQEAIENTTEYTKVFTVCYLGLGENVTAM